MAIPSCITDDPDFYDVDPDQQRYSPDPTDLSSAQSTPAPREPQASPLIGGAGPSHASGATGGTFGLGRATIPFRELPEATRELDGILYNILLMNLKGSKNALLFCVKDPSYVHPASYSPSTSTSQEMNAKPKCSKPSTSFASLAVSGPAGLGPGGGRRRAV